MHLRVKHAYICCGNTAPLFSVLPYWLLGEQRLCACGRGLPQREIALHSHAILQLVRCNSLLLDGSNLPPSCYAMIVVTCSQNAVELKGRAGAVAENALCVVESHLQLDDPGMPGAHTGKACEEGTWHAGGVLKQLSFLDRFLPVWIIGAMGLGLLLGYFVPAVERAFDGIQIDSVSLPIAIGYSLSEPCGPLFCSHNSSPYVFLRNRVAPVYHPPPFPGEDLQADACKDACTRPRGTTLSCRDGERQA